MTDYAVVEERFLRDLRRHLAGIRAKIELDFSEAAARAELERLQGDPVYAQFGFASPTYVLIRLVGRISISIGRRLGELYDKVPRILTAARFGLSADAIAPKFNGLELDIGLLLDGLSPADRTHVIDTTASALNLAPSSIDRGVGIEIRYNFNPNDSARLRKDADMARYVRDAGLMPVYLVFSSISPRNEAISRLGRAGWRFLIGNDAIEYARQLIGMSFSEVLERPEISAEVLAATSELMQAMVDSYAFQAVLTADEGLST